MSSIGDDEGEADGEPPIAPGTLVGEYEVGVLLGQGGFGSVYRAVHPLIGKSAAVKVLKREFSAKPEMVARFISEARSVNQIRHRNIIDIFSFGKLEDGRQYFVMELLEGMPLDKYLKERGRISIAQAIPVLRQLARALGAAHAAGITHRDIKPENVFLTFDDDRLPVPKLLDFGIAKLVVDNASQHKTRSGVPMGTPLYMSPEQVHGRDIDQRSDIYSFGVMVFQLLTGEPPFNGETMMAVMMKQIGEPAPLPSATVAELPPAIDAPILRMLETEPEKRPATILEAVDELVQAAVRAGVSGPVSGTPSSLEPMSAEPWAQTRLAPRTPAKVPSDASILGASDTLVASETPSHEGEGASAGGGARRVGLVAALALSVGAIGAGAFIITRPPAESASATSPASSALPSAAIAGLPLPADSSAPVVSAAQSSAVSLSATVNLVVKTNPAGAEIWHGQTKLGRAGEEIALPRGADEIVLDVKKTGYQPQALKVTPSADIAEAVILSPQPKTQSEYGSF